MRSSSYSVRPLGPSLLLGLIVLTPIVEAAPAGATTPRQFGSSETMVTVTLEPGTHMILRGTIDNLAITVTCSSFSGSGTAPSTKRTDVTLSSPPSISGCTDSVAAGDKDTLKTDQTYRHWTFKSPSGKSTYLTMTIPKAGASFASNFDPSCVITTAPTGADPVKGRFDKSGRDAGTDTVTNAPIPVSVGSSPCTTSSPWALSATMELAPTG
jgi:hypothetical protein